MIYVGIDPGIVETAILMLENDVATAFVVKDDWTETKGSRIEPARLRSMVKRTIDELRNIARHGDFFVGIEEPFVGENGPTALKQYAVFACLLDRLYEALPGQSVFVVPPTTLKKFVGAKKKMFIAREVMRRWGFESEDHNVVDAYAIAEWVKVITSTGPAGE